MLALFEGGQGGGWHGRVGEWGLEGGAGRQWKGGGRRQRGRREGEGVAAWGKGHNRMSE